MKRNTLAFALGIVMASSAAVASPYQYRIPSPGISASTQVPAPSNETSSTAPGVPASTPTTGASSPELTPVPTQAPTTAMPPAPAPAPRVFAQWDPANTGASYAVNGVSLRYLNVGYGMGSARADVGLRSGKWYWEVTRPQGVDSQAIGVVSSTVDTVAGTPFGLYPDNPGLRVAWKESVGWNTYRPNLKNTAFPRTSGDVLGFAVDMDSGVLYVYENCSETPYAIWSGMSGTWYPTVSSGGGSLNVTITANFGATPLQCAPPAGFNAGVWRH